MAKSNEEGEPRRLRDNEDSIHRITMKKILSGMFGYSSHRNPRSRVFKEESYMTADPDQWLANREKVTGTQENPLGWYRRFSGAAPIPVPR